MTTYLLPLLKVKYPHVKIGFLCGSWSKQVVVDHPLIDTVHVLDHWTINRTKKGVISKYATYVKSATTTIREIKEQGYDLSIDAYLYFPNASPIVWRAQVPNRIGFNSGGFKDLLTNVIEWKDGEMLSVAKWQAKILHQLGIHPESNEQLKPSLLHKLKPLTTLPNLAFLNSKNYIVVHLSAGDKRRNWILNEWKTLIKNILDKGYLVVASGKGAPDEELIRELDIQHDGFINTCSKLNWEEYINLIANCFCLICVDSVPIRIASAFDIPNIILFSERTNRHLWKPSNKNGILLPQQEGVPLSHLTADLVIDSFKNIEKRKLE